MKLKFGGFEFTRKIGVGDREHVRQGMLGIGLLSSEHTVEQLNGACRAAHLIDEMFCRAHVNADQVKDMESVYLFMRSNANDQVECWSKLNREQFNSMIGKLDILIQRVDEMIDTSKISETIQYGVTEIWRISGGRFLGGNFGKLSEDTLSSLYQQFVYNTEPFWQAWMNLIA